MTHDRSGGDRADALARLIHEVRMTFRVLRSAARDVHGGSGLTAGRRGVLLDLVRDGAQTVPALARARHVSRQHVQTLVNSLHDDGLVTLRDNPRHARSKLVDATDLGRDTLREMVARERDALAALPLDVDPEAVRAAADVLERLRQRMDGADWDALLSRRGGAP